ncbi:hypothetical protein RUM44_002810 [Polyplax serrata]|uniref:Secreted protein n=1 Tax=Polyplax serrata TaxID=468196 RepID=A0ABR1AFY3_POLSC
MRFGFTLYVIAIIIFYGRSYCNGEPLTHRNLYFDRHQSVEKILNKTPGECFVIKLGKVDGKIVMASYWNCIAGNSNKGDSSSIGGFRHFGIGRDAQKVEGRNVNRKSLVADEAKVFQRPGVMAVSIYNENKLKSCFGMWWPQGSDTIIYEYFNDDETEGVRMKRRQHKKTKSNMKHRRRRKVKKTRKQKKLRKAKRYIN